MRMFGMVEFTRLGHENAWISSEDLATKPLFGKELDDVGATLFEIVVVHAIRAGSRASAQPVDGHLVGLGCDVYPSVCD